MGKNNTSQSYFDYVLRAVLAHTMLNRCLPLVAVSIQWVIEISYVLLPVGAAALRQKGVIVKGS